ncbi:MAG: gamma-glutamyltransferase [Geminicoccaceae bacterium]
MTRIRLLSASLVATFLAAPPAWAKPPLGWTEGTVVGVKGGVVAAADPSAAEAGARVLAQGGNAIDAAVAVQMALNVTEPANSGIGGGALLLIHLATGEDVVVDGRETAPAAATPDQFVGMTFAQASTSGISVGVPGTLAAMALALDRWGTVDLATALRPAIQLAREGFPVPPTMAGRIADDARDGVAMTAMYPGIAAIFRPDGVPLRVNDHLQQPDLARSLAAIAEHGIQAFYGGDMAKALVAAQHDNSRAGEAGRGRMAESDLAAYRPIVRVPLRGSYRDVGIVTVPPPSSGGIALLQMLHMLEPLPIGDAAAGYGFGSARTLDVMQQAMRLAFADRALWVGDTDEQTLPIDGLLDARYLDGRAQFIVPGQRRAEVKAGDPRPFQRASIDAPTRLAQRDGDPVEGIHTTQFTVADRWGNVVSCTSTIESLFGSGIVVPGYGFLLNNELTDFNLKPTANPSPDAFDPGANDVAPGKRPRTSMTPTFLYAGDKLTAAYGSPGGPTIINTVLNITLDLVDHGMDLAEAVASPRLSLTSASPTGTTSIETGFDPQTLAQLWTLGYRFNLTDAIGSVQAVKIDPITGLQEGAADPRRDGTVVRLR